MGDISQTIYVCSDVDVVPFGCPHCGCSAGFTKKSVGNSRRMECAECGKEFIMVASGQDQSDIDVGGSFPKVSEHPRKGIPKHPFVQK